jgi:hypothetical protein
MPARMADEADCWLCGRALGSLVERHHPVPKSRGGKATVSLHPICHRTLHAIFSTGDLGRFGADRPRLAEHPDLARFLTWIAGKPPDFHAPTRRKR